MKRMLLVLILIAVAISGCTEKGPGESNKSAEELKSLSVASANNLSSYSLTSSMTQTLKLNAAVANETLKNATTIMESMTTAASVNLSSLQAMASGSTMGQVQLPGQPTNSSSTKVNVYQIGNSTYVSDGSGNWTHLKDPRSAEDIWGQGNNNQVKAMAESFSQSNVEMTGSEAINGEDAYKLKIVTGSADFDNLYNTAFGIAAKLTSYPMLVPSINRTELNETGKIEKTIWISKKTFLPVKYQSQTSFQMTPEVIGAMDPNTGQMKMFNQSVTLGAVSANIETSDLYYDFDKPVEIILPAAAISAKAISPDQIQPQVSLQA